MTSRMEYRNYRSSAQLVHCNIHQKRYNHFPPFPHARKKRRHFDSKARKGLWFHSFWDIYKSNGPKFYVHLINKGRIYHKVRILLKSKNRMTLNSRVLVLPVWIALLWETPPVTKKMQLKNLGNEWKPLSLSVREFITAKVFCIYGDKWSKYFKEGALKATWTYFRLELVTHLRMIDLDMSNHDVMTLSLWMNSGFSVFIALTDGVN